MQENFLIYFPLVAGKDVDKLINCRELMLVSRDVGEFLAGYQGYKQQ